MQIVFYCEKNAYATITFHFYCTATDGASLCSNIWRPLVEEMGNRRAIVPATPTLLGKLQNLFDYYDQYHQGPN